ncbi:uncharacterized protein CANTADRAFT_27564 [Suhomyces tanzawaensis NRRL Y-17324]|uniref:peptidylprolyl isomerase n=1 Tax=Suhomyces tanzawaensis NRRL Y-17324 TaxID=984487 RepID=A0A1E4SBL6_9ASCO|nr:uncharacterized protein CANTADRAFT_27564 [Suhomyces tanzawaensis NRRL Y-17324]ODV76792.1 hypothetical protein CANTADRAFT_27564 [Suhomyces tanzawaensis NRRL Y-17324]
MPLQEPTPPAMKVEPVRSKAFLDITIDDKDVGRIVLELFDDLAPKLTQNFLNLCKGIEANGKVLSYKDTVFHRVLKNFVIQAGDLKYGQTPKAEYPHADVGKGNVSSFNEEGLFEDENLLEPLDGPFKLCMANDGQKDSNGSQFFITTYPQPHLNGKHSIFGTVLHGKSVVREVERVDTSKDNVPVPSSIVRIKNCGEWTEGMEVPIFNASYNQIGGDIYEEYPEDDGTIDKDSSESVFIASSIIKESGGLLFKAADFQLALFKYKKCLRYVMEYIPDQDQEPEWYSKYYDLKKKLYLNLALVCAKLGDFQKSHDYSVYLLESDNLSASEKAKGHFRKGCSLMELRKYELALKDLTVAHELLPNDKVIENSMQKCTELAEGKKKAEKAKYAKFFK